MGNALKIFIIAGEESGDLLGGAILNALTKLSDRPVQIEGIGGAAIQEAGLNRSFLDIKSLSVMGIAEVLPKLSFFRRAINDTVQAAIDFAPDLIVTIDSPDFCFRVQKKLRAARDQGKIKAQQIHVVAPSVWAWRPGRAKKIAKFLDGLVCLFPFEPAYFERYGLRSVAVGHPAINAPITWVDPQPLRQQLGLHPDDMTVGLYLGSRTGVIKRHGEIYVQALNRLAFDHPDLRVIIPTFPEQADMIQEFCLRLDLPYHMVCDPLLKPMAMRACNIALAVSGTVGLELAIANVPHVVGYRMNGLTWFLVRLLVKTKYAHLANIILQASIVPELLQGDCTPNRLSRALRTLLDVPAERARQQQEFARVRQSIGQGAELKPADKAARFILDLTKGQGVS